MLRPLAHDADPSSNSSASHGEALLPDRIPPFAELRLIEAACRHRNYTRAARECGVTRPAVSFRVQRLEARFGVALFSRDGVRMRPTYAAWELARAYVEARSVLERAVEHLETPQAGETTPPQPLNAGVPRSS